MGVSLQTRRSFRSYRGLVGCTPLSAVDRLASLINGVQAGTALDMWRNLPDLSAYPDTRTTGLTEWSLETLLRDVLAYGGLFGSRDLKDWNEFADVGNKLHRLEEDLCQEVPHDDWIYYELFRIGHRQFDWQTPFTREDFSRYLNLYEYPALQDIVVDEYSLKPAEIIRIAIALMGIFRAKKAVSVPIDFQTVNVGNPEANAFIERFVTDLARASADARANSILDLNFAYRPSPFRTHPIVRLQPETGGMRFYCPVYRFLVDRLTDGLYYDLVKRNDFNNAYGFAFQAIVETICKVALEPKVQVLSERKYGHAKERKDSIDVILSDASGDLFVECKSRRVSLLAKTDLLTTTTIESEMEKLVGGAVQAYKQVEDALRGQYSHWRPRSLPTYLLIVHVRPWHIASPKLWEYIHSSTQRLLARAGLSPALVSEAPLTICSCADLELLVRVLREVPIDRVFAQKVEPQYSGWDLGTFLRQNYRDALRRQKGCLDPTFSSFERVLNFDVPA